MNIFFNIIIKKTSFRFLLFKFILKYHIGHCSTAAVHFLGKEEVGSSILLNGTIEFFPKK